VTAPTKLTMHGWLLSFSSISACAESGTQGCVVLCRDQTKQARSPICCFATYLASQRVQRCVVDLIEIHLLEDLDRNWSASPVSPVHCTQHNKRSDLSGKVLAL
jgi:hypothetical protein